MKVEDYVASLYGKLELTKAEKEFLRDYRMFKQYYESFDDKLRPMGLELRLIKIK